MLQTNYDLILFTDGSGHKDTFGGYAAYARTPDKAVSQFCMGAISGTSVDRAEFTALIEGLRICSEMWARFPRKTLLPANAVSPKPKICWYSDRESLVLSFKRVYARDNCPDLWRAIEYYEEHMVIDAKHVSEPFTETTPEFVEVDLQSSTGRLIIKNYFAATPLAIDYVPKTKQKVNSG